LGIGALNSGGNLLYLVFAMLLSMLMINAILSRTSLHGLSLRFQLPPRFFAETEALVRMEIRNHKRRFPSYAIALVAARGSDAGGGHFAFKIPAEGQHSFMRSQRFPVRGLHRLPPLRLRSSYPFGLIEKFIPVELEQEVLVHPRLESARTDGSAAAERFGDYLSSRRGQGVHPYGVREYAHGDDVRHIHWPSSARAGRWMLREFELEKNQRLVLHLIVDETGAAGRGMPRREKTVSALASALVRLINEQREVGLMINDRLLVPHGAGFIDFYLDALALFDDPGQRGASPGRAWRTGDEGVILGFSERPASAVQGMRFHRLVYEDGEPV
jgi:uncharacterized protein (DUF58 family)